MTWKLHAGLRTSLPSILLEAGLHTPWLKRLYILRDRTEKMRLKRGYDSLKENRSQPTWQTAVLNVVSSWGLQHGMKWLRDRMICSQPNYWREGGERERWGEYQITFFSCKQCMSEGRGQEGKGLNSGLTNAWSWESYLNFLCLFPPS